jgi:hypothetical protein
MRIIPNRQPDWRKGEGDNERAWEKGGRAASNSTPKVVNHDSKPNDSLTARQMKIGPPWDGKARYIQPFGCKEQS